METQVKFCPAHLNRRVKAKGLCGACYDKNLKLENPDYKKRQYSSATKWAKLNPEARAKYNAKRRLSELADPNTKIKKRNSFLKATYNINNDIYAKILAFQKGVCAICLAAPTPGKYLHVDHCHKSNKVRGLLCHQCNWYLGLVDKDPIELLVRLSMYGKHKLEWHQEIPE